MRAGMFDYHQDGYYFVTSVAHGRAHLLGRVLNGTIVMTDAGKMVEHYWLELEHKFPDVILDEYVIVPNHIHGILYIHPTSTFEPGRISLGDVMRWFKTQTTNSYIRGVKQSAWPKFDRHFWQPQYWDHIVRNDVDLDRIREYIVNNPVAWEQDPDNADSDDAWH
jgi:REP element-mobilizing transposase RayT